MKLSMSNIAAAVLKGVPGLTDPACREVGKDAISFTATRDGKRLCLMVEPGLMPELFMLGEAVIVVDWSDASISAYIVRELTV